MFEEPPWRGEPLLRLLRNLCLCLGLSGIASFTLGSVAGGMARTEVEFRAMVIQALVFDFPALILVGHFLRQHGSGWSRAFGLHRSPLSRAVGLALMAAAFSMAAAWALGAFSGRIMEGLGQNPKPQAAVEIIRQTQSLPRQCFLALVAIVLAPVVEEILFRGILFTAILQRRGFAAGVLINSFAFGLVHANLMTFLPLTFLGVILTLIYAKTGNLLTPIFAHAFFNLANFVLLILGRSLAAGSL